jgi:cyclopropane fatty-acyl-phospholipid synthase-like methyltransferase
MTAAETYAAFIDAVSAQRLRIHGSQAPSDRFGGPVAQRFRCDPHRHLEANWQVVASYVQPDDVLIDVGGGAGRISLPLALRCRQVINVDSSPGMLAEFEACAAEAGITNAHSVLADWLAAEDIYGDVSLASSVTYFVRDMVPFIEKMIAASRRRVMISLWSVPTANQSPPLFRLVYGEEQALEPGYRELLPVLWEMGILPDVRVLPDAPQGAGAPLQVGLPQTPQDAVHWALQGRWLKPEDRDRARDLVEAHFHELFARSPEGFRPFWYQETRQLLITWETDKRR